MTELYGLLLGGGVIVCAALLLMKTRAEKRWIVPLWAALCALLGLFCARLVYWLVNFEVYLGQVKNVLSLFWIRDGGLSMTGAFLGAALGTWAAHALMGKRAGLRTGEMLDALALPLLLFVLIERVPEWLLLQMGFGMEMPNGGILTVTRWLGIYQNTYLNVALLEALAALLMLALLWRAKPERQGDVFLLFLFLYGVTQTLFESLRTDGHMMWNFVHAQMLFAVLMAAFASAVFAARRGKLLWSLALSLLEAGLIVTLEFALDSRIKVPFDFMIPYARTIWYTLYVLVLALYGAVTLRFYHRHKEAVPHA